MPVHVRIKLPSIRDDHSTDKKHDDVRPGWASERTAKIEPRASRLLGIGKWLARATENSGPRVAPGIKSS